LLNPLLGNLEMATTRLTEILKRVTEDSPTKSRPLVRPPTHWLRPTLTKPSPPILSSTQPLCLPFPGLERLSLLQSDFRPTLRPLSQVLPGLPATMDDFELGELLGQGAYATVRKAVHRPTRQVVAVKTYERGRLNDAQRKKGVQRETQIQSRLEHPNIVRLMQTVETGKQIHLVLEYVQGVPIGGLMKQRPDRRLDESEAKPLFHQLLKGLSYCHNLNVCHRDIKLENLLITLQNVLKIIDFGFATCYSREKKAKMFCGTPNYMAPEIVGRREFTGPPTDVWAAGVVLYAMVSGSLPFKGATDRELYQRVQRGQYCLPVHISPSCKSLLLAVFALDPAKRPTAQQLLSSAWLTSVSPERRLGVESRVKRRESPMRTGEEAVLRAVLPRVMLKSASQKRLISREASPHPRSSTHNP